MWLIKGSEPSTRLEDRCGSMVTHPAWRCRCRVDLATSWRSIVQIFLCVLKVLPAFESGICSR